MGCSQCNTIEEPSNNSDFEKIKGKMKSEYLSYLCFLKDLKNELNISICNNEELNTNHDNENHNNITKKYFYIIPINWFENWEKRIEYVFKKDKFKSYNCIFEYKNWDNEYKFHFEFISNELCSQIYNNKIYNIKIETKLEEAIICNNLIIFEYSNNNIEIFLFEKEEDLFLTNLLFSFEKCNNSATESEYLLELLKSSPIHEIFGNMHYDYSKPEFINHNKKIIIYNKTRKVPEEIKKFRKEQYEKLFKNPLQKENNNENDDKANKVYTYNKNKDIQIDNYLDQKKEKNYFNNKFNNALKSDSHIIANELSRASTIMVGNNLNMMKNNLSNNNISNIKINQSNNCNHESCNQELNVINNKCTATNNNSISRLNYHLSLQKKVQDNDIKKDTKNKILYNNGEFSNIIDNKFKGTSFLDNVTDEKINESLLESVLYCLYNVKELTEYILNNNSDDNKNNNFYNNYIKIVKFLHQNNNSRNNLLKNCKDYNYNNLINIIIYQNGFNIISKIINNLHSELNIAKKKEGIKYNNSITEDILKKKEEKDIIYNQFINQTQENNISIIFNLFYGIKEIKTTCHNCNKTSYKYEIMNVLELSREKIIQFYKTKDNNNNLNLSIEDCLNYYKREEKLQDKSLFNCPFCNDYQNYTIYNDICKWSNIFIIYFYSDNNLDKNEKEELKININETINLLNDKYELFAIISMKNRNIKNNDEECKYMAYNKNISTKKWEVYDENNNKIVNVNLSNIYPLAVFYQK